MEHFSISKIKKVTATIKKIFKIFQNSNEILKKSKPILNKFINSLQINSMKHLYICKINKVNYCLYVKNIFCDNF